MSDLSERLKQEADEADATWQAAARFVPGGAVRAAVYALPRLARLLREAADALAEREARIPCRGGDATCPCQDGDPCHYLPHGNTPAMLTPAEQAELERERDAAQAWAREQSMEEREQRARAEKAERELEEARAELEYTRAEQTNDHHAWVALKAESTRLREQLAAVQAALSEALDGWQDAAQYKGEYLAEKHGDADDISRLRALSALPGRHSE